MFVGPLMTYNNLLGRLTYFLECISLTYIARSVSSLAIGVLLVYPGISECFLSFRNLFLADSDRITHVVDIFFLFLLFISLILKAFYMRIKQGSDLCLASRFLLAPGMIENLLLR